jgi:hypothetical protein
VNPVEKQFSPSELESIAIALGDTSEGLTGSEIGHILATLKMADPNPDMTKWKRLHNAFVERQNYSQNRRAIPGIHPPGYETGEVCQMPRALRADAS